MTVSRILTERNEINMAYKTFRDIYTRAIYDYIKAHNANTILYLDIMREFNISYPTVRKKVRNLVRTGRIKKEGKKMTVIS